MGVGVGLWLHRELEHPREKIGSPFRAWDPFDHKAARDFEFLWLKALVVLRAWDRVVLLLSTQ